MAGILRPKSSIIIIIMMFGAVWMAAANLCLVCNVQLHSIAGGMDSLVLPSDEDKRKAYEAARQLPVSADGKKWRLGEQDFEALMKHLDNVVSRN